MKLPRFSLEKRVKLPHFRITKSRKSDLVIQKYTKKRDHQIGKTRFGDLLLWMGVAATAALFLFHDPQPHVPSIARNAYALQSRGANEFHRYRGGVHIGHNVIRLYA